jgi:hypothetical protein
VIGYERANVQLLEPEAPGCIELHTTTVPKENVASVQDLGY